MKKFVLMILGIVVIGGGSFYAGSKYSQNNRRGGMANLSPEERQQRFQELGDTAGVGFRGRMGGQAGGGFTSGEIISKDDKSVTIKLRDGGSKIVFFSGSTEISKSAKGSPQDLSTGVQVTVNGKANSDGSLTAETVQIR